MPPGTVVEGNATYRQLRAYPDWLINDVHTLAIDCRLPHPAVDSSSIVSDLKTRPLDRFDQMQVLLAVHFAEHNVADLEALGVIHRAHSAELPGLDLPRH